MDRKLKWTIYLQFFSPEDHLYSQNSCINSSEGGPLLCSEDLNWGQRPTKREKIKSETTQIFQVSSNLHVDWERSRIPGNRIFGIISILTCVMLPTFTSREELSTCKVVFNFTARLKWTGPRCPQLQTNQVCLEAAYILIKTVTSYPVLFTTSPFQQNLYPGCATSVSHTVTQSEGQHINLVLIVV